MKTQEVDLSWAVPGAYAGRSWHKGDLYVIDRLTPSFIVCKVPAEFGGHGVGDYRFRRDDGRAFGRGEYGTIRRVTGDEVLERRVKTLADRALTQIGTLEGVRRGWGGNGRIDGEQVLERIDAILTEARSAIAGLREAAARP